MQISTQLFRTNTRKHSSKILLGHNLKEFKPRKYKKNHTESTDVCEIYYKHYFFKKLGLFDAVQIHHYPEKSQISYIYYSRSNSRPANSIKKLTNHLQKVYGPDIRNLYRFRRTDMEEIRDRRYRWIGRKWMNLNGPIKSIELRAPTQKGISMTLITIFKKN